MRKHTAGATLLLASWLLTGCTVVTGGRAVPADAAGPRPVPESALAGALLDARTVNDIMGGSGVSVTDSTTRLLDAAGQFADRGCLVAWIPAEQTVYAHSGWTAAIVESLREAPGTRSQYVVQAVVRFASRTRARDFFDGATTAWAPCGDRKFTVVQGTGQVSRWTFGAVTDVDSTLWMTQRQDNTPGWSCQRALRVSNNVVVDVLACRQYASDEAVMIAHGIDQRLPSA